MKIVAALILAFLIGVACRWLDVPVPAPPKLLGALLILAITLGYMATDRYLRPIRSAPQDPPAIAGR